MRKKSVSEKNYFMHHVLKCTTQVRGLKWDLAGGKTMTHISHISIGSSWRCFFVDRLSDP